MLLEKKVGAKAPQIGISTPVLMRVRAIIIAIDFNIPIYQR